MERESLLTVLAILLGGAALQVIAAWLSALSRRRLRSELEGAAWLREAVTVAPRSGYRLSGAARSLWEHSIPPLDALRYSVTFRDFEPGYAGPTPE